MKRLLLTLLSFCILLPLPGPATLDGAPKQGGNANSKKKTPAQKKKEEEQRKKARERAEAERKRRAQEEMKRKQAIEAARKKRLLDRVEEAKSEVRKCAGEAKELGGRYQKMLDGRDLIARSITRILLKPAKGDLARTKGKLLKLEEQFEAKAKDFQGASISLGLVKNSEKKTHSKGGDAETWEKTLLDLKRELSSANATIKSGESSNKSYGRMILTMVGDYVRAGVDFSESDKALIKKLAAL